MGGWIGNVKRSRRAMGAAAFGFATFVNIAPPAWAQTAPSGTNSGIEEIIVTAEKRETRLQETPSAITAISSDQIEDRNITGPEQLQFHVPSMVFGQQSGYSFLTLRGVGTDAVTTAAEPSVASYEDGVYTGSLFTQPISDFDLQRIEVLRGPQGTLYGRNATGGVINYITRAPSFDPEANLSVMVGSYDRRAIDAGITGPIVDDRLAYRLSLHLDQRDGDRRNINLGGREDDLDQWAGRGALLYQPAQNFRITLRGDYTKQDTSNPYVSLSSQSVPAFGPLDLLMSTSTPLGVFSEPASFFSSNPGLLSPADIARLNGGSIADYLGFRSQPGPPPPNPEETTHVSNGIRPHSEVTTWGASLTANWDVGAINVTSITAYRYGELTSNFDTGGFATPNVVFFPLDQTFHQWTQEIDVSGAAFDQRLDWVAGVFAFHDQSDIADMIYLPLFGDYLTANLSLADADGPYAFNLSQPVLNLFQIPTPLATTTMSGPGFGGGAPVIAGDISTVPSTAFLGFRTSQDSQSIAGFVQATYHLSDRLRITGGLRYTVDDKDVMRTFHSNLLVALGASASLCDRVEDERRWHALTGTASIDYDLTEHALIYARYARGYKAGGFNPGQCSGSFDPEYLDAYEVGVKSIFDHGQFLINAAAFYYDYRNMQFSTFVQNQSAIANAGAAELYGLEVEFQAAPAALPGFSVDGSASWVHSEYTGGNPFDPDGLFLDPSQRARLDIRGNELIRSPEFRFSLGAQYEINMANAGTLTVRGEGAWTDTIYNDIFNGRAPFQAATTQPAYWLVNARLIWALRDGHTQIQMFGENLTDELYATNRVAFNTPQTLVSVSGQFAAPRTFGLRLRLNF